MVHLPTRSRAVFGSIAAALTLAVASPAAAQSQSESQAEGQSDVEKQTEATPMTKGEQRLAKLLEGRVAGEPVRCIRTFPSLRMQTINGTAYVYGQGNTIYVQRTRNPESINDNDALVSSRFSATELCRLDVMTTVDRVTGIFTGAVFFEDFVPYTRVKADPPGEG